MSTKQLPPQNKLEERLNQLEGQIQAITQRLAAPDAPAPTLTPVTSFLDKWLPGLTLLSIIGFAFWLGTLSSTIKQTSEKVDKVYSQVLESKDSLTARTSVIEAKLEAMDKKLDQIIAAQK